VWDLVLMVVAVITAATTTTTYSPLHSVPGVWSIRRHLSARKTWPKSKSVAPSQAEKGSMWTSQKSRSFSEVGDCGTWGEMAIKLAIAQHKYQGKMAMNLVISPSLFHQEYAN